VTDIRTVVLSSQELSAGKIDNDIINTSSNLEQRFGSAIVSTAQLILKSML
jgi:hypothetical protein